jgi:hypothetical protein
MMSEILTTLAISTFGVDKEEEMKNVGLWFR